MFLLERILKQVVDTLQVTLKFTCFFCSLKKRNKNLIFYWIKQTRACDRYTPPTSKSTVGVCCLNTVCATRILGTIRGESELCKSNYEHENQSSFHFVFFLFFLFSFSELLSKIDVKFVREEVELIQNKKKWEGSQAVPFHYRVV